MRPWQERIFLSRDFAIFWAGQTLSTVGDAFAFVALPLLVLEATGSVRKMGLLTATFGVAQIAAGLFSGVIVDYADRRKIMIACDAIRVVVFASIPIWWVARGPALWLLFVVATLGAMSSNLFSVAYITATANLVQPTQLTHANSRLQGAQALAFVLGPSLAGLLAAKTGPAMTVGVDALSFLLSLGSLLLIRLRKDRADVSKTASAWQRMSAGLGFLFRHRVLRSVTILLVLTGVLDASLFDLIIYMLKHDFSSNDTTVGVVLGLGALGAVFGAVLAPTIRKRLGFGACFLGGTAIQGVGMMIIGVFPSVPTTVCAGALLCAAMMLRGVSSMSLRQLITPDHLLGRVTSAFWMFTATMVPLGAALGTYAASIEGASKVIGISGVIMLGIVAFGLLTPVRAAHPELDEVL